MQKFRISFEIEWDESVREYQDEGYAQITHNQADWVKREFDQDAKDAGCKDKIAIVAVEKIDDLFRTT